MTRHNKYVADLFEISTHTLTWSVTIVGTVFKVFHFISTHTLTWSVTISVNCVNVVKTISTHTLTWSVTARDWQRIDVLWHFNSHAHVERDDGTPFLWDYQVISTHTLTWSVTNLPYPSSFAFSISTHTLTWSVTLDVVYIWCLLNVMRTYFFI